MSEKPSNSSEQLTEEQNRLLASAITVLKQDLYRTTLRNLKITLGIVGLVVTGFGIVSWSSIRSEVISAAAGKFHGDQALRTEVEERASAQLIEAGAVLDDAARLKEELEAMSASASIAMRDDLDSILVMLEVMRSQVKVALDGAGNRSYATPGSQATRVSSGDVDDVRPTTGGG